MKIKTAFFVAIFLNLASVLAHADTITGNIRNSGDDKPLQLVLAGSDVAVEIRTEVTLLTYLRRMKTGDLLTAQGTLDSDRKYIDLESVDRMGLQELIGAWKSSRWEIFEFVDYNSLNLYIPTVAKEGHISLSRTHSLKYVVTPEQDDRFSIFISDNNDVRMGSIEVGKHKLTLSVTDSATGEISENISLSPLFAK